MLPLHGFWGLTGWSFPPLPFPPLLVPLPVVGGAGWGQLALSVNVKLQESPVGSLLV
jgi:hypothetical protein